MDKKIILIDDNPDIHKDFRKILLSRSVDKELGALKTILFNKGETIAPPQTYLIDSAFQGEEGIRAVTQALKDNHPYTLAFVDMNMPPGLGGLETITQMWKIDPNLQIVICTAYSALNTKTVFNTFGITDNLLILKKPFDPLEIIQLAAALTRKYELKCEVQFHIQNLENLVNIKTADLTAALDSIQEGIIAINNSQEIVTWNQNFLDMWNLTAEFINSNSLDVVLENIADQLEEKNCFLKMIAVLIKEQKILSSKDWKLINGKIYTFYSRTRIAQGKVIGSVVCFQDFTKQRNLEQQLLYQTTHDSLTQLPNRAILHDRLEQAIANAKRYGLLVGVVLLDLDNLKTINDSLGLPIGDGLLQLVATRLRAFGRDSDTIARFGGDEFALVLPNLPNEEVLLQKTQEMHALFSTPFTVNNHKISLTGSAGVSIYPKNGHNMHTLLKNADAALYHAKDAGRNMVQFYASSFNKDGAEKIEVLNALHTALPNNELCLHYQPLISLDEEKVIGVEALLRWNHPTWRFLSPSKFIPIAEQSGLILGIGEWVLRTACRQLKNWHTTLPNLYVAVNISVYQFKQENFVDLLMQIIKQTDIDPRFLELEITESLLLGNTSEIADKMQKLKELGLLLTIDDFGKGYSSLNYLKCFPFDKLKIDKSFIDNLPDSVEDQTIVEAIINMTRKMEIEVLAEGIEEKKQVDFLRTYKNIQGQGYYFSRPLDVKACTKFLKKN